MKNKITPLIIWVLITLTSCSGGDYYQYITKENPNRNELKELFPLLEKNQQYLENRFTVMNEIISMMLPYEKPGVINLLVTNYVNKNPDDPYNSYYLLLLASSYIKHDQNNFAIPYLHRIVKNYPDLGIKNMSTHYTALTTLVDITIDPKDKIYYYKRLIKDHRKRIDKKEKFSGGIGEVHYYLGQTYEAAEMWEESIRSFENFLIFEDTEIPKEPGAREEIKNRVGFYYSDKKWVIKDLDTLVKRVKYAINSRNPALLDRYRAHDFFIINWKSKFSDLKSSYPMESSVLTSMNIRAARELDPMSNENEAFLAVSGNPWSSSIWAVYPTWYFYFKRVDFPMNPEIHGGWEWAGIFLGEKL